MKEKKRMLSYRERGMVGTVYYEQGTEGEVMEREQRYQHVRMFWCKKELTCP